jgi:type IV secretory pathway component VirB8
MGLKLQKNKFSILLVITGSYLLRNPQHVINFLHFFFHFFNKSELFDFWNSLKFGKILMINHQRENKAPKNIETLTIKRMSLESKYDGPIWEKYWTLNNFSFRIFVSFDKLFS